MAGVAKVKNLLVSDRSLIDSLQTPRRCLAFRCPPAQRQHCAESQTKVQELETRMVAHDKSAEAYLAELERATALFQGLKVEKEQVQGCS